METILNAIWNFDWSSLLTYIGGAAGVAVFLQLVKKKFPKLDGAKLITFLLTVISGAIAVADYLVTNQSSHVIPKNFSYIMTAALLIHRFGVSPASAKIENFLNTTYADMKVGKSLREQSQPNVAPIAPTQPVDSAPIQDFTIK